VGDIIYGRRRAYQRKLAVADFQGICSAHAMVLRAKPDVCRPEFLPFFLQSELFHQRALEISVGSLSPTINWSTLAIQEFPLPPLDDQRRIADLLWAADDAISATSDLVDSISKLKASTRRENFGNGNGSKTLLKDLCEQKGIQIGPFGSQLHASDYVDNGIPVVMPANMTDDKIDDSQISRITQEMAESLSQHKVLSGDILLPRRGELDRRAFIYPEQEGWLCGTGSLRIRIKKGINPRAVFHALAARDTVNWLKNHAVGTTMPNINAKIVSNIPICLPENNKIDDVVETLEELDKTLLAAMSKREADVKLKQELLRHYLG
jgi:type I restriction enzyme S subunit